MISQRLVSPDLGPYLPRGNRSRGCRSGNCWSATSTRRDEAAFEVLVTRHGPMVLGVC